MDTLNTSFNLLDNDHIYGTACFNFLIITNRDDSLFNPLLHHFTGNQKCGKKSHSGEHVEPWRKQVDTDEPSVRKPQVSDEGHLEELSNFAGPVLLSIQDSGHAGVQWLNQMPKLFL